MDERDFVDAILDDPDDEMPRLVFADWLEEDGQFDRAAWVRACRARPRPFPGNPGLAGVSLRELEAWKRCRPSWWDIPLLWKVNEVRERGMIRLEVRSTRAVTRLGKAPWLAKAVEGGWVGCIRVYVGKESAAQALTSWEDPIRQVPIHLRVDWRISEGMRDRLAAIPRLIELEVGIAVMRSWQTPSIDRLVDRPDLRHLTLELGSRYNDRPRVTPDVVSALMARVRGLDRLRSLTLDGPRSNPGDPAFLSHLAGMTGLTTLTLSGWPDLRVDDLDRLRGMAGLRRLIVSRCPVSTDEGLRRVRMALPSLQIERL